MNYDMNDTAMSPEDKKKRDEMERNRIYQGRSSMGGMMGTYETNRKEKHGEEIEEIYSRLDERMCQALCFHEQLSDYFCFLGLQGFKRMLEYQYMKECAEKRKLHKRYVDIHHKVIPVKQNMSSPVLIPSEWSRYTSHDLDDSVIPKYVRMGFKRWEDWEKETRDIFEQCCDMVQHLGLHTDYEYIKELVLDVEKELKKIKRIIDSLNGTGYDVNMIHGVQDKYHEKYKEKYNDRFTTKNNYVYDGYEDDIYDRRGRRGGRRKRIGYR